MRLLEQLVREFGCWRQERRVPNFAHRRRARQRKRVDHDGDRALQSVLVKIAQTYFLDLGMIHLVGEGRVETLSF
jgi:hypothetical protein